MSEHARARRSGKWLGVAVPVVAGALVGGVLPSSCSSGPAAPEESVSSQASAIFGGTEDPSGLGAKFPAVVDVGGCSGWLVSDRVAITARHCWQSYVAGCNYYAYAQPDPSPNTPWRVRIPPNGSASTSDPGASSYAIDAITWSPLLIANDVTACCNDNPAPPCAVCPAPGIASVFDQTYLTDVALVHLATPVPNAPVLRTIFEFGSPQDLSRGRYDLDPQSLVQAIAHIAGMSKTSQNPGSYGHRAYGAVTINALVGTGQLNSGACTAGALATYSCGACQISYTSAPASADAGGLLPDSGACGVKGDSGGAMIINAAGLGATSFPSLPLGPLAIAVDSAGYGNQFDPEADCFLNDAGAWATGTYSATWDSVLPASAPAGTIPTVTHNGSFLRTHIHDWDNDGLPDDNDNCPLVANPRQENCNADAETAMGYEPRGDACDPIPCADAVVNPQPVLGSKGSSGGIPWEKGRQHRNAFTVQPRGSHYYGNGSHNGRDQGEIPVGNLPARYRYCVKNPGRFIDCGTSSIGNQYDKPDDITKFDHPYLYAHTAPTAADPGVAQESWNYPLPAGAASDRVWRYDTDYATWVANGWITATDDGTVVDYGYGTNLDGRYWIRTMTTQGTHGNQVATPGGLPPGPPPTTGFAVRPDGTQDFAAYNLPNHYAFLQPDPKYLAFKTGTIPQLPFAFRWWKWPWPCVDCDVPGWHGQINEDSSLVRLQGGSFGVLDRSGKGIVVDALLGSNLKRLLASVSTVWASASEPLLGIGPDGEKLGFHALAFDAAGTDVIDGAARTTALAFVGSTADLHLPNLVRPGGPGARSAFAAVYSRAEDAAFVVGGVDSHGGATGEIWMRRVNGPDGWRKLALGAYAPATVLAATWAWHDQRLWVLDSDAAGQTARLVRIQPYLGLVETVGQWTRSGLADGHWLMVDIDGQMLLVSSSSTKDKHVVARFHAVPFDSVTPVVVEWVASARAHAVVLPPLVDRQGYTFVYQGHGGLQVHREAALTGKSGKHASLDGAL